MTQYYRFENNKATPCSAHGLTTGAVKQLKLNGFTTACGGIFSKEYFDHAFTDRHTCMGLITSPSEPIGKFMTTLTSLEDQISSSALAVNSAIIKLNGAADTAKDKLHGVSGKLREGAEKLSVAIDKVMVVSGRKDYAEVVRLTESLVGSLERLAELEQKGLLDRVIRAMAR
jgi:hypothetical protein